MKREIFFGTLISYLGFPVIVSVFLFVCTWTPISEPFFGTDVVDGVQGQIVTTAGETASSNEAVSATAEADKTLFLNGNQRSATPARPDGPLQQISYVALEGILWAKWRPIAKAIDAELETNLLCRAQPDKCSADAATKFNDIVNYALKYDGHTRLGMVNRTVNLSVKYTSERQKYAVDDHWATPFQTLESRKGDCKDCAITKYAVLRPTGLNSHLRSLKHSTDAS